MAGARWRVAAGKMKFYSPLKSIHSLVTHPTHWRLNFMRCRPDCLEFTALPAAWVLNGFKMFANVKVVTFFRECMLHALIWWCDGERNFHIRKFFHCMHVVVCNYN